MQIDSSIVSKLHPDITVSDSAGLSGKHFPDYMIIGPQRTGTTWLSECLRLHPQVLVSRPKEVHYFNLLRMPKHPEYNSTDFNWYLKHFEESLHRTRIKRWEMFKAYWEWYQPKVRGEATASYAALSDDGIQSILKINPDIKIIMGIRNPIERAWSHAKKDLARNQKRKWQDVSETDFLTFFRDPYQLQCGHYSQLIERWKSHLSPNQFKLIQFEEIAQHPHELLMEIYAFLGVKAKRKYTQHPIVTKRVNPTSSAGVPPVYEQALRSLFQDEIDRLASQYNIHF